MINTNNGSLKLSEDFALSPQTTYSQIRSAFPDNRIWEVGTGYVWVYFSDIQIEDMLFCFSLCFYKERLAMVDFWFRTKDEKVVSDWSEWTEEYELNQRKKLDQWLTQKIGNRRKFAWGNIGAYYNQKSAYSSIVMNFIK